MLCLGSNYSTQTPWIWRIWISPGVNKALSSCGRSVYALRQVNIDMSWGARHLTNKTDYRLQSLSTLLKLPPSLAIISAQILLLRLTVPADLYQNGILVEVQGVRVHINVDLDAQEVASKTQIKANRNRMGKPSKGVKGDKPRSNQSHVHDPGGSLPRNTHGADVEDHDPPSHLPTTVDLAKSFLHSEPKEEKAELQASVTQSMYLDQSQMSIDEGNTGIGNIVSLPAFLADFLKGVGDRVKIEIQDIEIDMTVRLDRPFDSSSAGDSRERPEQVTLRLSIRSIQIDSMTLQRQKVKRADGDTTSIMQESRQFTLSDVEIFVISEASLFTDLARSVVPPSPETNHSSSAAKSHNRSHTASYSSRSSEQFPFDSPLDAHLLSSETREEMPMDCLKGVDATQSTGNTDRNDDHVCSQPFAPERSENDDDILANSFCSGKDLGQDEYPLQSGFEGFPGSLLYHDTASQVSSEALPAAWPHSFAHDTVTNRKKEYPRTTALRDVENLSTEEGPDDHASSPSPPMSDHSLNSEDLTESKMFTHEEASVYMSAISRTPGESKVESISIPGRWDSAGSDHGSEYDSIVTVEDPRKLVHDSLDQANQSSVSTQGLGPAAGVRAPLNQETQTLQTQMRRGNAKPSSVIGAGTISPSQNLHVANSCASGSEKSSASLKSSDALMKRVAGIDTIVAMFPIGFAREEAAIELEKQESASINQDMPGGFGQASQAFDTGLSAETSTSTQFREYCSSAVQSTVDIGDIHILGDLGLSKMMVLVVQRLNASREPFTTSTKSHERSDLHTKQVKGLKLTIKKLNWKFLDVVKGKPFLNFHRELPGISTNPFSEDSEILLRAEIESLLIVYETTGSSRISRVSIGKFCFGYSSDNILSFDSGLKMRDSTRDPLAPIDHDITVTYIQDPTIFTADILTLPLHIALDLRRLDETFSWFGGFSSMLGLGSSMMSTITIVDVKPKALRPSTSTRGVRFAGPDPSRPLRPGQNEPQNKVTARVGGLSFDLNGTQSSLLLESTALKIVSRTEGIGLQIDRIQLSGPVTPQSTSEPSLKMQMKSLRVEYLPAPKEVDLARLLALLSPSKEKDARDDDILLETLLRQRRQGAIMRATVEGLEGDVLRIDDLRNLPLLAEDLKKLSTVTKYLPEDDRPGLLVLGLVRNLRLAISVNDRFGSASLTAKNLECAHVTFPTLLALGINTLHLYRNNHEELLGAALPGELVGEESLPTIMVRFIGNEMEPTAKIKIHNLRLEYHVSTVMAIMGLDEASDTDSVLAEVASSLKTVTSHHAGDAAAHDVLSPGSPCSSDTTSNIRVLKLDVSIRDSIIGLNPRNSKAKGLLVLTDTHLQLLQPGKQEANVNLEVRKSSIMIIDEFDNALGTAHKAAKGYPLDTQPRQIGALLDMGFVSVGLISAAKATIQIVTVGTEGKRAIDIEIRDNLFVLETCADSTQTLQGILNGLKPPMPPSTEMKYMTEVIPIEDMLASLTEDALLKTQNSVEQDDPLAHPDEGDMVEDEVPQNLEFVSSFYNPDPNAAYDDIADSVLEDDLESLANPSLVREIGDKNLLESFQDQAQVAPGNQTLEFQEDHFGVSSLLGNTAHGRSDKRTTPRTSDIDDSPASPLRIRVRDVHVIWNLFDGYDWQHTRDAISEAVEKVQNKASERLAKKDKRKAVEYEEGEESVIGDFLFNSIYIGITANRDPRELTGQVNRNLDDLVSEMDSSAPSTSSGSPSRQGRISQIRGKKLRLKRSRSHKMTFELKGVSADVTIAPPGQGETQSSVDVRIQDLEIFDHVPTSTWKKFATYMQDAGERQSGTSMVHLQIKNVKPVPHLAASEIILKVSDSYFL